MGRRRQPRWLPGAWARPFFKAHFRSLVRAVQRRGVRVTVVSSMATVAQELRRRADEFFGEEDRFAGNRLYEAIVLKAREMHVAGATVLRGPMGFGHSAAAASRELRAPSLMPLVANQS